MSKWKLISGGAVIAAAFAVPVPTFGAGTSILRLVPTSVTAGDTITGNLNPVGGTTVGIANVGDVINFTLFVDVENDDANTVNDQLVLWKGGITSTSSGAGQIQGTYDSNGATSGTSNNPGVFTLPSWANTTTGGTPGYETDGENSAGNPPAANALVNSVGGTDPTNGNGGNQAAGGGLWTFLTTGSTSNATSNTSYSNGGISYTEFNLGSFQWIATNASGGTAVISAFNRPETSGTSANKQVLKYVSDGTTETIGILFNSNLLTLGNVTVTATAVPEPASLGLLGMGLAALGLRARRKKAIVA